MPPQPPQYPQPWLHSLGPSRSRGYPTTSRSIDVISLWLVAMGYLAGCCATLPNSVHFSHWCVLFGCDIWIDLRGTWVDEAGKRRCLWCSGSGVCWPNRKKSKLVRWFDLKLAEQCHSIRLLAGVNEQTRMKSAVRSVPNRKLKWLYFGSTRA